MDAIRAMESARWFTVDEFPPTAQQCNPALIERLDEFRGFLGQRIHPSRNPEGWVRDKGSPTSRHYKAFADAGDIFPERPVLRAFLLAVNMFDGVGIYYDTKRGQLQPGAMLHVDLRGEQVIWCRNEGRYIYPGRDRDSAKEFWYLAFLYADWENEGWIR